MLRFSFERAAGALLLMLTVILSLMMIHSPGTYDVRTLLRWTDAVYQNGLVAGYAEVRSEYPPISFVILYTSRALAEAIGLSPETMYKATILTCQVVSTAIILMFSGSFWIAAAFNASILLGAVCLGYMDVCFAPPLIAAFWAFQSRRNVLGTALFLLACLIKWQPLIIAPFIAVYLLGISDLRSLWNAARSKLFLQLSILTALFVTPLALIFGLAPVRSLWHGMSLPMLSGTALNIPWIAGFFYELVFTPSFSASAELPVLTLSFVYLLPFKAAFVVFFGVLLVRAIVAEKTFENCLRFSIAGMVTYATWNTNVHENHWFLAVILAYTLVIHEGSPRHRAITAVLAAMLNVNLFVFYGVNGTQLQSPVVGIDLTIALAILYAVAWLLLTIEVWQLGQPRVLRVDCALRKPSALRML